MPPQKTIRSVVSRPENLRESHSPTPMRWTAGGAGVLPGVLLGLAAKHDFADAQLVDALATAGLVGAVVAHRAPLSGAEGGCQAETGAAAGMAAGAATQLERVLEVEPGNESARVALDELRAQLQ